MIRDTLDKQISVCRALYPVPPQRAGRNWQKDFRPQNESGKSRSYGRVKLRSRLPGEGQPGPGFYDPTPSFVPTERSAVSTPVPRISESVRGAHRRSEAGRRETYDGRYVTNRYDEDNLTVHDPATNAQEISKRNPTSWGGFRDMLATECTRLLQRRAEEFEAYENYAEDLEREVGGLHPTVIWRV